MIENKLIFVSVHLHQGHQPLYPRPRHHHLSTVRIILIRFISRFWTLVFLNLYASDSKEHFYVSLYSVFQLPQKRNSHISSQSSSLISVCFFVEIFLKLVNTTNFTPMNCKWYNEHFYTLYNICYLNLSSTYQ